MAITILDAIQTNFGNSQISITQNLTLTSGLNRVVIVGGLLNSTVSRVFSTATYGGNNLTEIDTIIETGQFLRSSLYYIKEADLPSDGANDIVLTANFSVTDIGCFGMTIDGVDQALLVEDFGSEQGATTATSLITLAVTLGAFQIDMLAHRQDTGTLTWGAGQVEQWDEDIGGTRAGASSQLGAPAGNEDIEWTSTVAQRFAHVAASFVAAGIGGTQQKLFVIN